jgi:hypothetical protein
VCKVFIVLSVCGVALTGLAAMALGGAGPYSRIHTPAFRRLQKRLPRP